MVGVIGCGTVSEVYLDNLTSSSLVEVVACSDVAVEQAARRAAQFGIPLVHSQAELLGDTAVELVVNLTPPSAHHEVTISALRAGKHVWTEKPLSMTREEGTTILQEAGDRGLQVGCAPDTVLGSGLQTARQLLDDGLVGEPLAAAAFFMNRGPERWHPNPVFLYQPGAGPLFDSGVYYVTALVNLLGPVRRVSALGRVLFEDRLIGSGPRAGERFAVGTDTYVTGLLEFESGVLANLVATFGVWGAGLPYAHVYGSGGVLSLPDPNTFGGPLSVHVYADGLGWRDLPLQSGQADHGRDCRGIGVIDMVRALREGRPPRASAQTAYHVLDVMESMAESAASDRHIEVASTCQRPSPLPPDALGP
jgi:predicted dehydrogenase